MKTRFKNLISVLTLIAMFFLFSYNVFRVTAYAATEHVTWNPNDKNSAMTLSNNNLTAHASGVSTGIRATVGKSSGKWYWEYHIDTAGNHELGIANASAPLNWVYGGNYGNNVTIYGWSGYIRPINKTVGTTVPANSTVGIALNLDNKTITFYVNGIVQYIPIDISAMGDIVYPYFTNDSSTNYPIVTANFGATPFSYSIPEGYLPYESEQVTAPTNLIPKAGNTKINLQWDAVDGATGYNIKYGTKSGDYTILPAVSSSAYSGYDVNGLTNGIPYYFVVSALNGTTESSNSIEVSATPTDSLKLKLVLELNEEKQLSVTDDLTDNTDMAWTSSDTSIATVDGNGKLKAIKPGNTVVTSISRDGSYAESVNVLVVDLSYQLAVDLKIGETCRLTVDDLANAANVTWTAYDTTIATVSNKGKVTAVSEGLTYVTATDNNGKEIGRIYIRVRE